MIDGTYNVEVDSPLGRKQGKVALRVEGDKVLADIDAPVIGKKKVEGTREGESGFSAQGSFKVLLAGKVEYTLRGQVEGDELRATVDTNKGAFELTGSRS